VALAGWYNAARGRAGPAAKSEVPINSDKDNAVSSLHGGWVVLLSLAIGCAGGKQSARHTASIERPATMKSTVLEGVPRGTPLAAAKEFMEHEGFQCSVIRNGKFADQGVVHEGIDFLWCDRRDRGDMWVHRRWQIIVVLENDSAGDVYVSEGLIGP